MAITKSRRGSSCSFAQIERCEFHCAVGGRKTKFDSGFCRAGMWRRACHVPFWRVECSAALIRRKSREDVDTEKKLRRHALHHCCGWMPFCICGGSKCCSPRRFASACPSSSGTAGFELVWRATRLRAALSGCGISNGAPGVSRRASGIGSHNRAIRPLSHSPSIRRPKILVRCCAPSRLSM